MHHFSLTNHLFLCLFQNYHSICITFYLQKLLWFRNWHFDFQSSSFSEFIDELAAETRHGRSPPNSKIQEVCFKVWNDKPEKKICLIALHSGATLNWMNLDFKIIIPKKCLTVVDRRLKISMLQFEKSTHFYLDFYVW